jgi:hypothetical protein
MEILILHRQVADNSVIRTVQVYPALNLEPNFQNLTRVWMTAKEAVILTEAVLLFHSCHLHVETVLLNEPRTTNISTSIGVPWGLRGSNPPPPEIPILTKLSRISNSVENTSVTTQ